MNPPVNPPEDPIYPPEDYDYHYGVEGKNEITRGRVRRKIRSRVKSDDTYSNGDPTGEMIAIVEDPVVSSNPPTDDSNFESDDGASQSSSDNDDTVAPTDSDTSDVSHYTPIDYGTDDVQDSSDEDSSGHSDLVTDGGPIYVDIGSPKLPTGGGHGTPIFTGWRPTGGAVPSSANTPFAVDTGNDDRLTAAVKRGAAYDEYCWIVCDASGRFLMQTNHCSIKELKNIINSTWVPTASATYYVLYEITSEGVKEYSYESSSGYLNTTHSSSEQRLNDIYSEVSSDRADYEETQSEENSEGSVETPEEEDTSEVDWWSDPGLWGGGIIYD